MVVLLFLIISNWDNFESNNSLLLNVLSSIYDIISSDSFSILEITLKISSIVIGWDIRSVEVLLLECLFKILFCIFFLNKLDLIG